MSGEGGYFAQGESAYLSSCRVPDRSLVQSALDQILRNDGEDDRETILFGPADVSAQFDHDDDTVAPVRIPGTVVITSEQILFWQHATEEPLWDLRVDAVCIDLHALISTNVVTDNERDSEDWDEQRASAVYIQISNGEYNDETCGNTDLFEFTLHPVVRDDEPNIESSVQALCRAITKLVSLHPVDPNGNDEAESDATQMFDGPVIVADDGETEHFGLFRGERPVSTNAHLYSGGEATDEEHAAMLERLDSLLIVPDELDDFHYCTDVGRAKGQFDDAEDDPELV